MNQNMILTGTLNDYVRSLVSLVSVKEDSMECAIFRQSLYAIRNYGILYRFTISPELGLFRYPIGFNTLLSDYHVNLDIIEDQPYYRDNVYNVIMNIHNNINYGKKIYDNPDLKSDESFQNILSLKSDSPSKQFWFIDNDGKNRSILLHSNVFKLNKPDKIGVKIYKTTGKNYAIFKIYKQKLKIEYDIILSYIDIL